MTITRPRIAIAFVLANAIYWLPAIPFPDQVKGAVNASLMILSLMTSLMLIPDLFDIWMSRGANLSWQALLAKVGLFTLSASFFLARVWSLLLAEMNYPDDLLHGPIGGFLTYLMGIGMFGIFVGFNSVGDVSPKFTPRGILVVTLLIGVVVGVVVGKLPV